MKPEDFVAAIREAILEQNLISYADLLAQPAETVQDDYWRQVLEFFVQLTPKQQKTLRAVMRQVMVDTLSHFLGILDGTSFLAVYRGAFSLTYEKESARLNGQLQDLFLAGEQSDM